MALITLWDACLLKAQVIYLSVFHILQVKRARPLLVHSWAITPWAVSRRIRGSRNGITLAPFSISRPYWFSFFDSTLITNASVILSPPKPGVLTNIASIADNWPSETRASIRLSSFSWAFFRSSRISPKVFLISSIFISRSVVAKSCCKLLLSYLRELPGLHRYSPNQEMLPTWTE